MEDLSHVRWIGGGTSAGKTTVARILSRRFPATVYDGDQAEPTWQPRCDQRRHPHLYETYRLTHEEKATLTPKEKFDRMPSRHGETIGFVIEDLLTLPNDKPILVDWSGLAPRDVHPLLKWREQAVFMLPSQPFRLKTLTTRFTTPARARANWGTPDPPIALANRLARDGLWDAEVRAQATELALPTITTDGTRSAESTAEHLARQFRL